MKKLICLISCILITGCTTINPPQVQSQLHKPETLKTNLFLIMTDDTYSIQPPGSGLSYPLLGTDTPRVSQYLQNQSEWQQWKFGGYGAGALTRSRIVGLLAAGTHYTINTIIQNDFEGYLSYYFTITSGPFAGITAPFVQY